MNLFRHRFMAHLKKLQVPLWEITIFSWKNLLSMAIFHSYLKLPEGQFHQIPLNHHVPMVFPWFSVTPRPAPILQGPKFNLNASSSYIADSGLGPAVVSVMTAGGHERCTGCAVRWVTTGESWVFMDMITISPIHWYYMNLTILDIISQYRVIISLLDP